MILQRLLLKNFKQYSTLDLPFREGLIGIIGKNGAGKSSIFDAVLLCLFGSAVGTDKAFYKTSWAGKKDNVRLELFLEVAGKPYRILREFRGKALAPQANIYDPGDKLLATGAKAVNEAVSQLIGMDKDAFTRSIFSGQKELGILSNTRGEERKRMVRKMIGLDNLDQIQKLVREDRNNLRKNVEGQKALLLDEAVLKTIKADLKGLQKKQQSNQKLLDQSAKKLDKQNAIYLQAKKDFNTQLEILENFNLQSTKLTKYQTTLEGIEADTQRIEADLKNLATLKVEQTKLEKPVAQHRKNLEQLTQMKAARDQYLALQNCISQRANYSETLDGIKAKIKTFSGSQKVYTDAEKSLKALAPEISKIEKELEVLNQQLQAHTLERGKIQGKINERHQQLDTIQQLGPDAACPTCLRPLITAYQETIDKLNNEIALHEKENLAKINKQFEVTEKAIAKNVKAVEKLAATQDKTNRIRSDAASDLKQLQNEQERLEKGEAMIKALDIKIEQLGKITFNTKDYEQLTADTEAFEDTYLKFKIDESKLSEVPNLKANLARNKDRATAGQEKIKAVKAAIKAIGYTVQKHEAAKTKQDAAEVSRDEIQRIVQEYTTTQHTLQTEIEARQQRLKTDEAQQTTIAKNMEEFQELESLDGLFKAFKTFILDKIKPTITNYAGSLFERITKGRYEQIEVDDNFDFHIYENGTAYPISRFSGGEIDLANLCLRIGISRAIAELSGSTEALTFLGFDEIFGSQDEERRLEILLALEHLKEQYRQIYIITHVDTVKDYFPNILQVTKTGKGSKAVFQ